MKNPKGCTTDPLNLFHNIKIRKEGRKCSIVDWRETVLNQVKSVSVLHSAVNVSLSLLLLLLLLLLFQKNFFSLVYI